MGIVDRILNPINKKPNPKAKSVQITKRGDRYSLIWYDENEEVIEHVAKNFIVDAVLYPDQVEKGEVLKGRDESYWLREKLMSTRRG
jgi:hypothetical protein